jgi:hypothetical protein
MILDEETYIKFGYYEDYPALIKKELIALKAEEVWAINALRNKYPSGVGVDDLLQDLELVQKRRVKLEIALKILEELK